MTNEATPSNYQLTPNDYQLLAMVPEADQSIIRQRIYDHGIKATRLENAVRGLADDCGELNGAVKKWLEYGQPLDEVNVVEEIGDCLWRLAQAATAIGVTLEDCMKANLRKLKVRYGDGICTPEKAAEEARDRAAEREAVEQTGAGWAEPPEEDPNEGLIQAALPSDSATSEREREQAHNSYRRCEVCGQLRVHKNQQASDTCTDCTMRVQTRHVPRDVSGRIIENSQPE